MDYEPWDESHAPRKFDRTDRTGRWSPLQERQTENDPAWMMLLGGVVFGVLFAALLWLAL